MSSETLDRDESLSSAKNELDDTIELKQPKRPDLVEISDAFDNLEINPVLKTIAETNELAITWQELKKILDDLIKKQNEIMEDKIEDENTKKVAEDLVLKIGHSINDHMNCPFTIQRLCELVIEPKKYYKMYVKYLRAVEKVLLVTSYWEDYAHSNDKDQTMEESPTSERLLTKFSNSIELEPHNFPISETNESNETANEVTDQISRDTKEEIKDQLDKNPIQFDDQAEKTSNKDPLQVEDESETKNEKAKNEEEGDVEMKSKAASKQEDDAVIEKVELDAAPKASSSPQATTDASEDSSKMDLD